MEHYSIVLQIFQKTFSDFRYVCLAALVVCVLRFSLNKWQLRSRLSRISLYLESIIGPTSKLHVAVLIIKREPRDVYLACALEDARWHIQTTAVMFDHNICVERAIESLIRTMSVYVSNRGFNHMRSDDKIWISLLIIFSRNSNNTLSHWAVSLTL